MFHSLLRALPLRCHLCHLHLDQTRYPWCKTCHESLPKHFRCLRCGFPTPYNMQNCGQCLTKPPPWDNLVCVGDYTFPYDILLHKFKYKGHYWLAAALARLLSDNIKQASPVLLAVPMHWQRRLVRGFNHSALLAQNLADQLHVDCQSQRLKRIRSTRQQQGLTRKDRLSNLKGAFAVTGSLPEHVALVDDVVTTGATLCELSKLLRQHGVKRIEVYCIARSTGKPK